MTGDDGRKWNEWISEVKISPESISERVECEDRRSACVDASDKKRVSMFCNNDEMSVTLWSANTADGSRAVSRERDEAGRSTSPERVRLVGFWISHV